MTILPINILLRDQMLIPINFGSLFINNMNKSENEICKFIITSNVYCIFFED